ncbi:aldehyde dehydrogenase family protein [Rhodanobacter sp. Si-c]|uniref:Aldehyde dehydrogenase family protein n=1 Tax=Rhodanobacter lycopersici TaxID=3162487 RepID=A0ABV3QFL3_9GAMM
MKAIYDEAIQITHDSRYGLHTCVFGIDLERVRRVASRIRVGRVLTNGMTDDPQVPTRTRTSRPWPRWRPAPRHSPIMAILIVTA